MRTRKGVSRGPFGPGHEDYAVGLVQRCQHVLESVGLIAGGAVLTAGSIPMFIFGRTRVRTR